MESGFYITIQSVVDDDHVTPLWRSVAQENITEVWNRESTCWEYAE